MAFRVGQKVVCIKDGPWKSNVPPASPPRAHPQKGDICQITWTEMYEGDHFLAFKEFGDLDLFLADHFRPLVTRKTDISIFKKMLTDDRVDA
jgi:hypothetical protein